MQGGAEDYFRNGLLSVPSTYVRPEPSGILPYPWDIKFSYQLCPPEKRRKSGSRRFPTGCRQQ